jgi:hypothetical protein
VTGVAEPAAVVVLSAEPAGVAEPAAVVVLSAAVWRLSGSSA